MTVLRALVALLVVGGFAGTALADCDGLRIVERPAVVASADGATTPVPVRRPVTPRAD